MVHFNRMTLKSSALAAALVAGLQLAVSAQADITWNSHPEARRGPAFFRPGDPLPAFIPGALEFRPLPSFEESEEDRERRMDLLSKCGLLADVRGLSILDVFVGAPNSMMDFVASTVHPGPERGETFSYRSSSEGGSVVARVFSEGLREASPRPFDALVDQLVMREQRYFARFRHSNLATIGVEDGSEDLEIEHLMADQRKLLFDSARRLYFGRLSGGDDRLRDESLDVSRWHPVDYVVAPAMIGGFLFVRGWEKDINLLGLRCGFQVEPVRRILERLEGSHNDLASAASLELGMGDFPVKVIVSFGIQDGHALMDFVGIGTSVGKVKQVIENELGGVDDDR
jgi:hypothetical protein